MLQECAAVAEVLDCQCLADGLARLFGANLSESEECSISHEQSEVLVIQENTCEFGYICILRIILIIERWSRVIRSESQLGKVNTFCFSVISFFVPLEQVLSELTCFNDHFRNLLVAVAVPLEKRY